MHLDSRLANEPKSLPYRSNGPDRRLLEREFNWDRAGSGTRELRS